MRKKKLKDDDPIPETTEEQADVLDQETPPEAPSPDFQDPETAPDNPPRDPIMEEFLKGEFAGEEGDLLNASFPPAEEEPELEQQPLFGKADEIINVLETERSSVRLLIGKAYDTIIKKKDEIVLLEKRQENINKAIEDCRAFGGETKPDAGPLFEPEAIPAEDETKPAEEGNKAPESPCSTCASKIEDGREISGLPGLCLTYPAGIPSVITQGEPCDYRIDNGRLARSTPEPFPEEKPFGSISDVSDEVDTAAAAAF